MRSRCAIGFAGCPRKETSLISFIAKPLHVRLTCPSPQPLALETTPRVLASPAPLSQTTIRLRPAPGLPTPPHRSLPSTLSSLGHEMAQEVMVGFGAAWSRLPCAHYGAPPTVAVQDRTHECCCLRASLCLAWL
ncbi:hypothetical protein M3J09_011685 [Ascochyta lentis]